MAKEKEKRMKTQKPSTESVLRKKKKKRMTIEESTTGIL